MALQQGPERLRPERSDDQGRRSRREVGGAVARRQSAVVGHRRTSRTRSRSRPPRRPSSRPAGPAPGRPPGARRIGDACREDPRTARPAGRACHPPRPGRHDQADPDGQARLLGGAGDEDRGGRALELVVVAVDADGQRAEAGPPERARRRATPGRRCVPRSRSSSSDVATPSRRAARTSRRTVRGRSIGSPPVRLIARTSPAAAWRTRSRSSPSVGSPRMSGLLSTLQWPHRMLQRRVTMSAIDVAGGSVVDPDASAPSSCRDARSHERLDGLGHPGERPAAEVEGRDAVGEGREDPDGVPERPAGALVRVGDERQQGMRGRDRLGGARARRRCRAGRGTRWRASAPPWSAAAARSRRDGRDASRRGRRWTARHDPREEVVAQERAARRLRRDTRRGAGRAAAAAGSTMATSSPSSAAPRAHSAQASVDLPASPRPASRTPRPSQATRAPCTITTGDSTIAATAPYSTALTARAALGTRTISSRRGPDPPRRSRPVAVQTARPARQRLGMPSSVARPGWKTVAASVRTAGSSDSSSKEAAPPPSEWAGRRASGSRDRNDRPVAGQLVQERGDVPERSLRAQRRERSRRSAVRSCRRGGAGEPRPRAGCRWGSGRARCGTSGGRAPRDPRRWTPRPARIARRQDPIGRSVHARPPKSASLARMLPTAADVVGCPIGAPA